MRLLVPWSTLFKIIAAVAIVWLWQQLVWVLLLVVIAIIIAVGLQPLVHRLEQRGWARWLASSAVVIVLVGALLAFVALTWASLWTQAQGLGEQIGSLEREVFSRIPPPIANLLRRSGAEPDASMVAPYLMALGRAVLSAAAAFVLAWILVLYLLIEREQTYRWVRGFVPGRLRRRFDRTAAEARRVAFAFLVGNVTMSTCAAAYFFGWLTLLGVPAALLLALLAFLFDFIPVLGFYLSVLPAMAMAATRSATLALWLVPVYLSYDVIENYLIGPRVYGGRLRLSKVAVLLSFAVGATLGGVVGAVLALPFAAIYPTIERLWLRGTLGDEVVAEHEALTDE